MIQPRSAEEAERLLSQFARNNPDVLWMFAPDWSELRFVTEAYEDLWGRSIQSLLDDPLDFMNGIHPEDRETVREAMQTLQDGDAIELEVRVVNERTGGIREVWIEGQPVYDDDGTLTALSGYVRDISERKRRERALEEVMGFLSHDLRNQIQIAMGHLDLAASDGDAAHLDAVAKTLERMVEMTEDVLTLPQVTPEEIDREPVSVVRLALDSWEGVRQEDATLHVAAGRTLRVDASRFQNVLENLFRNAVRHNEGTVEITVGALPDGRYVEDDGRGIPTEHHDDVFELGFSTKGTGLGLPFVREIITAHGGTISVGESGEGGARFEITGISLEPAET
ncbi:MAG: sensor histidine kinase [Halanaeroarchaeum sp.]